MAHAPPKRKEKLDLDRILAAIHTTDSAAFRELYDAYASDLRFGIRGFLRKVPRLRPYEEDIVSRAWVRLLARDRRWLKAYDPDRASFSYFMRMVGANTAWQVAVLKGHSSRWSDEDIADLPLPDDTDLERTIGYRKALELLGHRLESKLSGRERTLLEEVILLARPTSEVAEDLGTTPQAVWTATSRLRLKIRELTEDMRRELGPTTSRTIQSEPLVVLAILGASILGVAAPHGEMSTASPSDHLGGVR